MSTLTRHFRPANLLVLLGMILLAIGLHGYAQFGSTAIACYPEPTIWDIRVTEVTLQSIAYTDGCNFTWGPSYAALWPVGIAVTLLGGGFKIVPVFSRDSLTEGVGILLIGVGLIAGSVPLISGALIWLVVSALCIGAGIVVVVFGWVRE